MKFLNNSTEKQVMLFTYFRKPSIISTPTPGQRISVRLQYEETNLMLQIRDDGIGMETGSNSIKGAGLINMKNHAEMMGANLSIITDMGKGTEVTITVPNPYYQV
jgi:nitrate/nitrite-specific signal transduction histidine kinase